MSTNARRIRGLLAALASGLLMMVGGRVVFVAAQ
jgi:hypothetical protein